MLFFFAGFQRLLSNSFTYLSRFITMAFYVYCKYCRTIRLFLQCKGGCLF